jgi:hypothetical protein
MLGQNRISSVVSLLTLITTVICLAMAGAFPFGGVRLVSHTRAAGRKSFS